MGSIVHTSVILAAAAVAIAGWEARADACGCLSPPEPVDQEGFAINQQAEQIIFEVEDEHVAAHVLIRYAGSPEKFAWIIPVPVVPELSLSSNAVFGLLDEATSPVVGVTTRNDCPEPEYICQYHPLPDCDLGGGNNGVTQDAGATSSQDAAGGGSAVEVLDRQTVGSYETVVFSAGNTGAAVQWLRAEGFIVNETMSPYMQPYADAGMLFLASKLVPGADVSEIRPLKMRYPGQTPMIPLRLTAVAAEPHMTITSYIFAEEFYRPQEQPLATIDRARISMDGQGRVNYPMVLSRTIDEAGGNAFVSEFAGTPRMPDFDQGSGCCSNEWDNCSIGGDNQCQCPSSEFDESDCQKQAPGLMAGLELLSGLNARYPVLTRLTTRLSPEEMTFDPMFIPVDGAVGATLSLTGSTGSLAACEVDVLDNDLYEAITARQECSALYCGTGECVVTGEGAACACQPGSVARMFTDLDGLPSVTCIPEQSPVDLEAGGIVLPSSCDGLDCSAGTCVDVGGFPACSCDLGSAAAVASNPLVPTCHVVTAQSLSPGAQDFSTALEQVPVCAPAPPTCGSYGWLVRRSVSAPGIQCETSLPDMSAFQIPDVPTCEDLGFGASDDDGVMAGCGCATSAGQRPVTGGLLILVAIACVARRRRC